MPHRRECRRSGRPRSRSAAARLKTSPSRARQPSTRGSHGDQTMPYEEGGTSLARRRDGLSCRLYLLDDVKGRTAVGSIAIYQRAWRRSETAGRLTDEDRAEIGPSPVSDRERGRQIGFRWVEDALWFEDDLDMFIEDGDATEGELQRRQVIDVVHAYCRAQDEHADPLLDAWRSGDAIPARLDHVTR